MVSDLTSISLRQFRGHGPPTLQLCLRHPRLTLRAEKALPVPRHKADTHMLLLFLSLHCLYAPVIYYKTLQEDFQVTSNIILGNCGIEYRRTVQYHDAFSYLFLLTIWQFYTSSKIYMEIKIVKTLTSNPFTSIDPP